MSLPHSFGDCLLALSAHPWFFGLAKGACLLVAAAAVHAVLRRIRSVPATLRHAVLIGGVCMAVAVPVIGFLPSPSALRWKVASAPLAVAVPAGEVQVGHAGSVHEVAPAVVHGASRVAVSPAPSRVPWFSILCILWAAGGAAVLLPLIVSYGRLAMLDRRSSPVRDRRVQAAFAEACGRAGVCATLRQAPRPGMSPGAYGAGSFARVMVPSEASAWSDAELRFVFDHELAHVARHDWEAALLAQVALALQWFNPAAWWVVHQIGQEAELACDGRALAGGASPTAYADCLVRFVARFRASPSPAWTMSSLPFASPFSRRIVMVLDRTSAGGPVSVRTRLVLGTLALLGAVSLGGASFAEETVDKKGSNAKVEEKPKPQYEGGTTVTGGVLMDAPEGSKYKGKTMVTGGTLVIAGDEGADDAKGGLTGVGTLELVSGDDAEGGVMVEGAIEPDGENNAEGGVTGTLEFTMEENAEGGVKVVGRKGRILFVGKKGGVVKADKAEPADKAEAKDGKAKVEVTGKVEADGKTKPACAGCTQTVEVKEGDIVASDGDMAVLKDGRLVLKVKPQEEGAAKAEVTGKAEASEKK